MRQIIKPQLSLFNPLSKHKLSKELQKMSSILDRHPRILQRTKQIQAAQECQPSKF